MTKPNIIPNVRILTSECNNSSATASATVNIIPEGSVKYGEEVVVKPKKEIQEEKNIYKLILDAHIKNPIRINNKVVMNGASLCKLIKDITGTNNVEITAEEDVNCLGKASKYLEITNIICIGEYSIRTDFDRKYNKEYRLLKDYNICLDFISNEE